MDTVKNSFTDDEELKILQDLIAIHSVNDHEMEVALYLQNYSKSTIFRLRFCDLAKLEEI